MRVAIIAIALLSAGCSNPGQEAEKRYEIIKRSGTLGDVCDAGRQVANAYLNANDAKDYEDWKLKSDIECMTANQQGRHLSADEDLRHKVEIETDAAVKAARQAAQEAMESIGDGS